MSRPPQIEVRIRKKILDLLELVIRWAATGELNYTSTIEFRNHHHLAMIWLTQLMNAFRARFKKASKTQKISQHAVLLPIQHSPGKYLFFCPGCQTGHMINTNPANGWPCHRLTGTLDKPTVRASVLAPTRVPRCHSFITEGRIEFLNDCTHELAGRTVELAPL